MSDGAPFSIAALDAMSGAELRAWSRALLDGRHPFQLRPDTVYPAELLGYAFREVHGATRRVFQDAVCRFLQELVDGDDTELDWRSDAGVELIRALPDMVFGETRDQVVNLLLRLAREWTGTDDADEIDFRLVALGGLLDLFEEEEVRDSRLGWEFWASHPVEGPNRLQYITTLLDGMSRSSADDALGWLASQRWDEEARAALEYIAPTLLLSRGFDAALERHGPRLNAEAVSLLRTAVEISARPVPSFTIAAAAAQAGAAVGESVVEAEHLRWVDEVDQRRQRVWEPDTDPMTVIRQIYAMDYRQQVEQILLEHL